MNKFSIHLSVGILNILLMSLNPIYSQRTITFNHKINRETISKLNENDHEIKIFLLLSDFTLLEEWIKKNNSKVKISRFLTHKNKKIAEIFCYKNDVEKLIQQDWVIFIDKISEKFEEEAILPNFNTSVNNISLMKSQYPEQKGDNIVVSIKELSPFDYNDIDFKGRILNSEFLYQYSFHSTIMASIIAGAGNKSENSEGIAKGAYLHSSNLVDLFPDNTSSLQLKGVTIQNHSYGVGIENYYGLGSYLYDKQLISYPEIIHIFSAGNEGKQPSYFHESKNILGFGNITGQIKSSKNTLCVGVSDEKGEVRSISSSGPTKDGRVKPEIIAYGANGSSESAALVSGVASILQQAFYERTGNFPRSSMIKSLLINSAKNRDSELTYQSGYGNIDALEAIEAVFKNTFIEDEINSSQTLEYIISVPEKTSKLSLTLCWDDPASLPEENKKILVNDLDVSLIELKSKNEWHPWILNKIPVGTPFLDRSYRGVDTINNVEKITLNNPDPGEYIIRIKSDTLLNHKQKFSVVYSFGVNYFWLFPSKGSKLPSDNNILIRWNVGERLSEKATLEFKSIEDLKWIKISDTIDFDTGAYSWIVPNTNGIYKLRIITSDTIIQSEQFTISNFQEFDIEYFCADSSVISWQKIPNVQKYNIYYLKDKYMKNIGFTNDTIYKIRNLKEDLDVAVAPVIDNLEISRSNSQRIGSFLDCYFQYIVPLNKTATIPEIKVLLRSVFNLKNIFLERLINGRFEVVRGKSITNSLEYVLKDEAAPLGENLYRASVQTKDDEFYFSNVVQVYSLKKENINIKPIPALAGQNLEITVPDNDIVNIKIFDITGKILYHNTLVSSIKLIDTSKFSPGLYFALISTTEINVIKQIIII